MLTIENLTKAFDNNVIFENFNLKINNEIIGIMAPSGSGKTTLINCITGKYDYSGCIEKGKLSVVFQEDRLFPWLSLYENIEVVCKNKEITEALLNIMDIDKEYWDVLPKKASGGMKQRINLARALSVDFDLLIMDEGLKGLDNRLKTKIMDYIKKQYRNKSVLFMSHDLYECKYLCSRTYIFEGKPLQLKEIL